MKHKVVTTEQGKVLVDESADIKEGDWFFANEAIRKCIRVDKNTSCPFITLQEGEEVGHFKTWRTKIIATINFSLDKDIPMVIVEDEVEKLALNFGSNNSIYPSAEDDIFYGFVAGYKASQQKATYSEEVLREAVQFGIDGMYGYEVGEDGTTVNQVNRFIQSLKQEYIELDTMISFSMVSDNYGKEIIRTDLANRQLMAYVKNCKTQSNDNKKS